LRLWSLHPRYLDPRGLTALWREALLARAVLSGETRGYQRHPQLQRFRSGDNPLRLIDAYLFHVRQEAERRGYRFRTLLVDHPSGLALPVTAGQLAYELAHLRQKLSARAPEWAEKLPLGLPDPHPLFVVVPGGLEPWERPRPTVRPVKDVPQHAGCGRSPEDAPPWKPPQRSTGTGLPLYKGGPAR